MQVSLHQKDMEIQEWEEKHKKFIEKAKSVVKSMDAKNVSLSDVDISVLENRLLKANKEISDLKVCIVDVSYIYRIHIASLYVSRNETFLHFT